MPLPSLSEITRFFPKEKEHTLKNLLIVSNGVFLAQSTNLNKVKDKLSIVLENTDTKSGSHYKRLTRFFRDNAAHQAALCTSLLVLCMTILKKRLKRLRYLSMDGTSWEYGLTKVHLLVLSVVVKGISIPICWIELSKSGASNLAERIDLIKKALNLYKLRKLVLLADREYVGEEWFKYLKSKGLDFVIRVKKKDYKKAVDSCLGAKTKGYCHQPHRHRGLENQAYLPKYRHTGVSKQITLLGETYTFVIFKNPKPNEKDPLVYFVSTLKDKKKIVKVYAKRWAIECCFKHLKSNGFHLEDMHFRDSNKIILMMGIVTFLYVLCIEEGYEVTQTPKKSDFKTYADGTVTLAISVFRRGLSRVAATWYRLTDFLLFLGSKVKRQKIPKWLHVQ